MLSLKKTCSNTRIFISKMLEFEQHIWGLQHPNGPAKVCITVFVYPNPQFYLWQCANSICIRYIQYIYNYAEKHMALSQLFSREKPFHKNPMVSNLHFPMKMAVSPSGKSPPGHPGRPRSPRKLPIPPPCSRSPVDLSPGWELGITSFYNPYVNHGAGIWIQTFTP